MIGRDKQIKPFVFFRTEIGASHGKSGKPCQDYSWAEFNPENFKNFQQQYAIAIVADGHGSADYFRSDRGSRFACDAARKSVQLLMQDNKSGINHKKGIKLLLENSDFYIQKLKASIITRWRDLVADDFLKEPFTEEEEQGMSDRGRKKLEQDGDNYVRAYGTTLLLIVKHSRFWFGLHIGDGKCVAYYQDAKAEQPIPWDDRCFLNVTTSLCDEDAIGSFRHCFRTDAFPDALYIATDGVDDSFGTDERLYDFYGKLTQSFIDKGTDKTLKELTDFLPELSKNGSGDDISIAGIVNDIN